MENNHEILKYLPSNEEKDALKPRKYSKKSAITKVKGFVSQYYVESIVIDGKPKFLAKLLDSNDFIIKDSIEIDDRAIQPLNFNKCGYTPYSFTSSEIMEIIDQPISTESLIEELKSVIDRYIVAKDLDKYLIVGNILVTYCQELISTVHFPYFVGETESGKSSVLHLGKFLNYRCLYGEDIPNADIYNFLGSDEEGCGTIAEDEAQELARDREKIRTYKNSYSKGSFKARMLITDSNKQQIYYKTFCPKWFAGEKIPQDKGFQERLAVVYMTEGFPQSNIKRITKEELSQLSTLRNKLLIWKLHNINKVCEKVETNLQGRDQELWEDFVSISFGTKYYDKFMNVAKYYTNQRHQTIYNSIEAKLCKAVLEKLDSKISLNFIEYWDFLTQNYPDLPGTFDSKSQRTFFPDEFPNSLSFNSVAKILEQKFQGVKHQLKTRDEDGRQKQNTIYSFQKEVLEKLAKKYGISIPLDCPVYGHERGEQGEHGNKVNDVNDSEEKDIIE
ncbi:MAG: hypothetical protein ACREAK_06035 [Nitrosarchaeum sp.]